MNNNTHQIIDAMVKELQDLRTDRITCEDRLSMLNKNIAMLEGGLSGMGVGIPATPPIGGNVMGSLSGGTPSGGMLSGAASIASYQPKV